MTILDKLALLHWPALFLTALGTIAVFLESCRFNARMPSGGVTLGDPPGWESWIYHCGAVGTAFLLAGIILQGVALFLAHRNIRVA